MFTLTGLTKFALVIVTSLVYIKCLQYTGFTVIYKDLFNCKKSLEDSFDHTNTDFLQSQFEFASEKLDQLHNFDVNTIGGLYAYIMLNLIKLESCKQLNEPQSTIFTGNPAKQLDSKSWYVTKTFSRGVLHSVTNLETALEALLEVCYEGEGGTPCNHFISTLNRTLYNSMSAISLTSKSHFVKFQEMAHGFEVRPTTNRPPSWFRIRCLDQDSKNCRCIARNETVSYVSSMNCIQFCFSGTSLDVDEESGVWPLEEMPLNFRLELDDYLVSEEARRNSDDFDRTYTNLLHCLNDAFNGNPSKMMSCIGKMYELQNAGYKLVRTPISHDGNISRIRHCLPRWRVVKDLYKDEGMMVDGNLDYKDTEIFC